MSERTKVCTKCTVRKPYSEFQKFPVGGKRQSKDGYDTRCKDCHKEYQRA